MYSSYLTHDCCDLQLDHPIQWQHLSILTCFLFCLLVVWRCWEAHQSPFLFRKPAIPCNHICWWGISFDKLWSFYSNLFCCRLYCNYFVNFQSCFLVLIYKYQLFMKKISSIFVHGYLNHGLNRLIVCLGQEVVHLSMKQQGECEMNLWLLGMGWDQRITRGTLSLGPPIDHLTLMMLNT